MTSPKLDARMISEIERDRREADYRDACTTAEFGYRAHENGESLGEMIRKLKELYFPSLT